MHSNQTNNRGARGFTLMELMVVVAIIAVLMSILVPVLSKVRASSARTACSSQLKQLANAMSLYAADFKGARPLGGNPTKAAGNNNVWVGAESWPMYTAAGGTNIDSGAVEHLFISKMVVAKSFQCPDVDFTGMRATFLGGETIIGKSAAAPQMRCDYTYWGQTDIFYGGVQQNAARPYPLTGFASRKLNGKAPYGTELTITRVATSTNPATTVTLRPTEISNLPLFSDSTVRVPGLNGYELYSHGRKFDKSWTQTCFADGHVESTQIDLKKPFFTLTATGNVQVNHYR